MVDCLAPKDVNPRMPLVDAIAPRDCNAQHKDGKSGCDDPNRGGNTIGYDTAARLAFRDTALCGFHVVLKGCNARPAKRTVQPRLALVGDIATASTKWSVRASVSGRPSGTCQKGREERTSSATSAHWRSLEKGTEWEVAGDVHARRNLPSVRLQPHSSESAVRTLTILKPSRSG